MKVFLNELNIDFPVMSDQTILDAALNHGVTLQHGCSNGRCGDCRAKLIKGDVEVKNNLFEGSLKANEILTCCSVPKSDIVVNAEYFPELNDIKRQTVPVKVDSLELLSENVLKIVLRMPPRVKFDYLPGQYLDFLWNGKKRSYSIAQEKPLENKIELHIKKVEGGVFSELFFQQIQIEQLFRINGPLGTFFLRNNEKPLIMLCTGTGFAPIKSLLEQIVDLGSTKDIYIYWGGGYWSDLYSQLPKDLAETFENIHFFPVLSREADTNTSSTFFSGYVQDAVLQHHKDICNFDVYACGSEQMISSAREKFVNNGLHASSFHYDAFTQSE